MQACLNGHVTWFDGAEWAQTLFCPDCGAETIAACPACSAPLQGSGEVVIHGPPVITAQTVFSDPPAFCYRCGRPLPWTEAALQALADTVNEDEQLDETEKRQLNEAVRDVVADTPRTPRAAHVIQRALAKAGQVTTEVATKVLAEIAVASARHTLGL